ncbi:hypothetical protein J4T77_05010 [Wolbachia endosymbiont of Drosophila innubila]|nr:hypothetical protein J4T77_05010 [Wolbachia endosymbiont of Drosophila innubila]
MWHIFSSTVKWLFIMNFVSNCQFFSLERCNKAIPDWDDTLLMGPNHNVRTVVGQAIG